MRLLREACPELKDEILRLTPQNDMRRTRNDNLHVSFLKLFTVKGFL